VGASIIYLARENGAEAAIRFMADADATPGEARRGADGIQRASDLPGELQQHRRIFPARPDGNASGAGYSETSFQSLKRLASGENDVLRAVDGSTTYHGWNDLVATVRSIIAYERGRAALVQQRRRDRYSHQSQRPHGSSDDGESRS
jgi:hypothetical protein